MGEAFAVVMAGGSGTRFWPASRRARPKQFLPLGRGGESLLQASVRRAAAVVGLDRVRIVAGTRHAEAIRSQLPSLPATGLMLEPVGRNTAPCLGWAAAQLRRIAPEAVVVVLPADAYVGDEHAFAGVLLRALELAREGPIVTLGIRPTRPETGYGYIERGDPLANGAYRVRSFVEKPDAERAARFVAAGHFWNSGVFAFRVDVILAEIAAQLPALHEFLERWDRAAGEGTAEAMVEREYHALSSISIDHGVMEKAREVAVVPADFGWDDVGSWSAAWTLADKDARGNTLPADAIAIDAEGCYVQCAGGKRVVLLGTRDLVVIDTPDALLIAPRERAQDVRQIVERLELEGDEEYL